MGLFKDMADDFRRHERSILNPAVWAVWNYRFGVRAAKIRFPPLRWFTGKVYGFHRFLNIVFGGITLNRETRIGKDFHIIHANGIMIDSKAVIGDRCGIMHQVTIGSNFGNGVPVIGDDVFIGAGAKILGGIKIGNNVIVAANSLVISDIPDNSTAIGVPARVWKFQQRREGQEE